jgi:antitoxin component YwqK of YwqJK toxin-antitoxin module
MKIILIGLFLVAPCFSCFGQGPTFQLWIAKACSNTEQLDTFYYLRPLFKLDAVYSPKNGTVYLPAKGTYVIGHIAGPVLDTSIIEFKDNSLLLLRYKEHRVQEYVTGAFDSPPLYVTCDKLINGYAEDFYPNGKLRIRGNFKNGNPKDSIVTFYPTGLIQTRILILPKVVNIEEFNSAGYLIKLSHNQHKSFMTYWEYEWIEYYPNGKVKSVQSPRKRVINVHEFYPSGQLKIVQKKKSRTEYYITGKPRTTYTWKSKKDCVARDEKNFTIFKNDYNYSGQIEQSTIYKSRYVNKPQPVLDIAKSDWIVSIRKFKDGKEFFHVEDVQSGDYLKAATLE